jgi:polysaccharide deacetylase 2 family uncharacterized protein YibQ
MAANPWPQQPSKARIAAVPPAASSAPAPTQEARTQSSAASSKRSRRDGRSPGPARKCPARSSSRFPDSQRHQARARSRQPPVERSRHGLLPKIGPDGATPAQVYARPLGPQPEAKPAGRIALLVGGLGISQSGTADAIAKLPGTVSLAFAPYGQELERTVQRARSEGHEVFLQVPMEPFDYPDNDPGPHTLLTGPKATDNVDRLQWVLGRFTGYVGIVNFLGGRLTADEAALSPILREIAGRGLMVVDDGSSSRSLLASSADRAQIPALKVDRVIDTVPRADAIDKELAALEAKAREQGIAVASASALPVSIERIARWVQSLEAKGSSSCPSAPRAASATRSTTGSLR